MSESTHWVVTHVLMGHSISFNMDTLITMWFAMAILIVFAILIVIILIVLYFTILYKSGENKEKYLYKKNKNR